MLLTVLVVVGLTFGGAGLATAGDSYDEKGDDRKGDNKVDKDGKKKYCVIHKPPGNPENAKKIFVGSERAYKAHLAHGDKPCKKYKK
ncbi:hypothetical protein [Halegenticoccus soli]|uniref:hypothetical protein n=1 Tax=Halegenticoccus soli TaxID=1985678 RepID=UPI000C6E01D8|nr:hypothetical protein [Halegenticoccus soli]